MGIRGGVPTHPPPPNSRTPCTKGGGATPRRIKKTKVRGEKGMNCSRKNPTGCGNREFDAQNGKEKAHGTKLN